MTAGISIACWSLDLACVYISIGEGGLKLELPTRNLRYTQKKKKEQKKITLLEIFTGEHVNKTFLLCI